MALLFTIKQIINFRFAYRVEPGKTFTNMSFEVSSSAQFWLSMAIAVFTSFFAAWGAVKLAVKELQVKVLSSEKRLSKMDQDTAKINAIDTELQYIRKDVDRTYDSMQEIKNDLQSLLLQNSDLKGTIKVIETLVKRNDDK
jgi:hypothetical protein